ncbi:hypothetical protein GGF37_004413 [Kickxella alabastrina]|nr:hypothetical protein GGF37_004413 [Kickxella alabastrina]
MIFLSHFARSTARPAAVTAFVSAAGCQQRRMLATITGWGAHAGGFATGSSSSSASSAFPANLATPTPLTIPGLSSSAQITAVGAGTSHALLAATTAAAPGAGATTQLVGFGLNRCHQLGATASNSSSLVCTRLQGVVKQIACGREHSAVLLQGAAGSAMELWVCGSNVHGQLGLDPSRRSAKWHRVDSLASVLGVGEGPVSVHCGLDHTLILTTSGRVLAMGWGADGQLGTGTAGDSMPGIPQVVCNLPFPIEQLSASTDFALARDSANNLRYWGNAEYGQAMTGAPIDQVLTPLCVPLVPHCAPIRDIAAAGTLSLVLDYGGHVFVCGYGALGLGPRCVRTLEPVRIPSLRNIVRIWASTDRCLAMDDRRRLYSWGLANAKGRLGVVNGFALQNVFEPTPLDISPDLVDPDLIALGNDIAIVVGPHCP